MSVDTLLIHTATIVHRVPGEDSYGTPIMVTADQDEDFPARFYQLTSIEPTAGRDTVVSTWGCSIGPREGALPGIKATDEVIFKERGDRFEVLGTPALNEPAVGDPHLECKLTEVVLG